MWKVSKVADLTLLPFHPCSRYQSGNIAVKHCPRL